MFNLSTPIFMPKFFLKKQFSSFFIIYDLIMLSLFYIDLFISSSLLGLFGVSIMLVSTVFCSSAIFLKIRKMMNLIENNHKLSTYHDLRRAAFICIFQTCLISLHLFATFYTTLYATLLMPMIPEASALFFFDFYMISDQIKYSNTNFL